MGFIALVIILSISINSSLSSVDNESQFSFSTTGDHSLNQRNTELKLVREIIKINNWKFGNNVVIPTTKLQLSQKIYTKFSNFISNPIKLDNLLRILVLLREESQDK